jgi:hypothetical protein
MTMSTTYQNRKTLIINRNFNGVPGSARAEKRTRPQLLKNAIKKGLTTTAYSHHLLSLMMRTANGISDPYHKEVGRKLTPILQNAKENDAWCWC